MLAIHKYTAVLCCIVVTKGLAAMAIVARSGDRGLLMAVAALRRCQLRQHRKWHLQHCGMPSRIVHHACCLAWCFNTYTPSNRGQQHKPRLCQALEQRGGVLRWCCIPLVVRAVRSESTLRRCTPAVLMAADKQRRGLERLAMLHVDSRAHVVSNGTTVRLWLHNSAAVMPWSSCFKWQVWQIQGLQSSDACVAM